MNNKHEELEEFNDSSLLRITRQTARYFTHAITDGLTLKGHHKLSARHLHVLENLSIEGTNIVSLAQRVGVTKQAMSKLVKEVADAKYVSLETDKADTRAIIVKPTEQGWLLIEDIKDGVCSAWAQMQIEDPFLSDENLEITRTFLTKINTFFENLENNKQ